MAFKVPEQHRATKIMPEINNPMMGNNGIFQIKIKKREVMYIQASDGEGWEHVSVSFQHRTPTWKEMCRVKDLFWDKDDVVIQYHPAESDYVNFHPHCLHLWRPIEEKIPVPPPILVGPITGAR